jgi:hypothetical protein
MAGLRNGVMERSSAITEEEKLHTEK